MAITVEDLIERLRPHVTYTLACEPEETPIEGNASAIDPETDAQTNRWIREQLRAGNEWAWCDVTVTAHYLGFHGHDYLGCCSYLSEEDFRTPGGYFDDMKGEALRDLATNIVEAIGKMTHTLETLGVSLC